MILLLILADLPTAPTPVASTVIPSLWSSGAEWQTEETPGTGGVWQADTVVADGLPEVFVAFNGKLATGLQAADWTLGRAGWFDVLSPNTASLTFTGTVDAEPRDEVTISTSAGVMWCGFVDSVDVERLLDGRYTSRVGASDIVGVLGRAKAAKLGSNPPTLLSLANAYIAAAGITGTRVVFGDSSTGLATLDDVAPQSGETVLEVIQRAERSSNAMLFLQRNGLLKVVTRTAVVGTSVETIDLSGDNAPAAWATSLASANVVNRWSLVRSNGTVVLDTEDAASIEAYGESTYDVSGYMASSSAHFPSAMRTALAAPRRIVTRGEFPITDLGQDIILLAPLSWVSFDGDTWQVMSVSHSAAPGTWRMSITADVSQNAMAGTTDPDPSDPPNTITSTQALVSTKSATAFKSSGGAFYGNGAGAYLPVGYYQGTRTRAFIDWPTLSWPSGFVRVKKATLRLRTSGQAWVAFGSSPKIYARRITEGWTEGTYDASPPSQYSASNALVWPGPSTSKTGQTLRAITDDEDTYVTLDVTEILQQAHDAGRFDGIALISANEDSRANTTEFRSDDTGTSAHRPLLTIICEVTA